MVERLADLIAASDPAAPLRVALDGAPPAAPETLADDLATALRVRGRPPVRIRAADFLRPAALRFEHGRHDPEAFYRDSVDYAALRREVLQPLGPEGSGRYLPTLWDAIRDRATRADYLQAPAGAVALVDGAFLLGAGLPFDLSVHLWLSPGAQQRRVDAAAQARELPAYEMYEAEVGPREVADLVVLGDDPRRPALVDRRGAVHGSG